VPFHGFTFDNILGIVAAFDMDVGPQYFQKRTRIVFAEDKGAVHHAERRNYPHAVIFSTHRSSAAFEPPDRFVGIDTHH
jgi:hypothetical protein